MTTINQEEIQKFSKLADEWWDVSGKFKPLHMFNPIRIEYILDKTIEHFNIKDVKLPLKGLKILDIGCGGGLISEPMSRLGASVTGIDASLKNIKIVIIGKTIRLISSKRKNHRSDAIKLDHVPGAKGSLPILNTVPNHSAIE